MAIPSWSPEDPSEDGLAKRPRRLSEPSAPSPGLVLFNSEDHCDVVFLVGQKPDQWRFPGHSFIIAPASPVFESIISLGKRASQQQQQQQLPPPSSSSRAPMKFASISNAENPASQVLDAETKDICQIVVSDTPPDVFENVLSFVYKNDIPFLTVPSALRLLRAAATFQLSTLGCTCLAFLSERVNEETVLEILPQLPHRVHRQQAEHDPNLPSPVTDELCANLQNELLLRCLDLIDDHAETVLRHESFEKLNEESVAEILSRDTLRVRTEMTVFEAATRWACQECKRRQMELVPENKREVLGKALYHIRYLAMTPDEFQRGPVVSNLLEDSEMKALMTRLKGDWSAPLPDNLLGRKMDSRRPVPKPALCCAGGSAAKRPLGRSCSFNSSSDRPSRRHQRTNSPSADGKKNNSTSKKFFRGLGDMVICLVQLLD